MFADVRYTAVLCAMMTVLGNKWYAMKAAPNKHWIFKSFQIRSCAP